MEGFEGVELGLDGTLNDKGLYYYVTRGGACTGGYSFKMSVLSDCG
jgi:hypothetical protein